MKYSMLGNSNIFASKLILGTMTLGSSADKKESFRILDTAFDYGINFFDTAELYAAPLDKKNYGITETIIGEWLTSRKIDRSKIYISSKVAGPEYAAGWAICPWIRGEERKVDRKNVILAIEGSLKRLQTDYVDLYMSHWPERNVPLEEQLSTWNFLINQGKIKYWGTSNEGPVNMPKLIEFCQKNMFSLPISQTMLYNLLHRHPEENGLLEVCNNNNVGTTIYSPLSMGILTGKYKDDKYDVSDSRMSYWPERYQNRFGNLDAINAAKQYKIIADNYGLTLLELSFAWILQQPITSIVIGVSKSSQLNSIVKTLDIKLSNDCIDEIDILYEKIGNPVLGI